MRPRIVRFVLTVCVVVVTATTWSASPAGADTAAEAFINRLYADFMLRDPTPTEATMFTAALAAGTTPAAIADTVLQSDEFAVLWVHGVHLRYLRRLATTAELTTAGAQVMGSASNFLEVEVLVLSSSAYLTRVGGTNTAYVSSLYRRLLFRDPDAAGLSYWTGRLAAGTQTRAGLARFMLRSPEAAGRRTGGKSTGAPCAANAIGDPDAIEAGSYCLVLDRPADEAGRLFWTNLLSTSGQLPTLWGDLAGSSEYYVLAGA